MQIHSHDYKGDDPDFFRDKTVVVLGMGNSAMDIAVEASFAAQHTYLAARRGAHVIPKYLFGKPIDQIGGSTKIPFEVRRRVLERMLKVYLGDMERYGLPTPDHRFGNAHPTVSDDILSRMAHGTITAKPNIASLTRDSVRFADGSEVKADVVVYCTGYKVTFPFFDEGFISAPDNDLPLFRRTFHPDIPNLFFVGLLQPLGAIMPIAEAQGAVGERLPRRALRAALPGPAARRHGGRAAQDVQALRRLQAPHDAGRLRRLDAGDGEGAQGGGGARGHAGQPAPGAAAGGRPGRRGVTVAVAGGRREATKAANRAAILAAGRAVFTELGYGAASVREIVRGTELAAGTFYNYFPDKESVFRALVHEVGAEARRRARAARQGASTPEGFVEDAYRAYFSFIVEDAGRAAFLTRNAGAIRTMFEESEAPAGIDELAADLRAAIAAGLMPELDVELCAAAMVAVALELGQRVTEGAADVDGATRFATDLFLGGIVRAS